MFLRTTKCYWGDTEYYLHGHGACVRDLPSFPSSTTTVPPAFHHILRIGKYLQPKIYEAKFAESKDHRAFDVIVKVALGRGNDLDALQHEFSVYRTLNRLQGIDIPTCYGLFEGMIHGRASGMLVLEYCRGKHTPVTDRGEYHRQSMMAISRIHEAGVVHNNLVKAQHHIVRMGNKGSVRIVDFSRALLHDCAGAFPVMTGAYRGMPRESEMCRELCGMERVCGYANDSTSMVVDNPYRSGGKQGDQSDM